jgi:ubiquinone/menaquinone biosynthesis C-methylase UbiE
MAYIVDDMSDPNRICPVERAGSLDLAVRKLIQNPTRILGPFIRPGMTVLDFGCGPGFFTVAAARMVGPNGKVFAADLQDGMLDIVKRKIALADLDRIVTLHKCLPDRIGLAEHVDLILVFYALHEVPDQQAALLEMKSLLKPGGKILVVEPKFHVSKAAFLSLVGVMTGLGFDIGETTKIFLSRTAVLTVPEMPA